MKTSRMKTVLCCLSIILATALCSISYAQTLTTDAADYAPGSIATITGAGFGAGETVAVQVTHNPTCCDDATSSSHLPWTVTADDNGGFVTTWGVPSDEDEL